MTWRNRWVVLVPGKVAWVEKRTRELLEEFYGWSKDAFQVIPGQGDYHTIIEMGNHVSEPELVLGDALAREVDKPVYAIERREENPEIARFLKGEESEVRQGPEELVRSLGCKVPWFDEPPPPPRKAKVVSVALIQGLDKVRVRNALAKQFKGHSRPEDFVITEGAQGLLMRDERGWLGMAMVGVALRFPHATIYAVIATPDLGSFYVSVSHKKKTAKFVLPPGIGASGLVREVTEILGERTPERILAALGIPKEWFHFGQEDSLPLGKGKEQAP